MTSVTVATRTRLPDGPAASYGPTRRGPWRLAAALLLSLGVHGAVRVVAPVALHEGGARFEVREPAAAQGEILEDDEVDVSGVTREGDENKAQGTPPAATAVEVPPPTPTTPDLAVTAEPDLPPAPTVSASAPPPPPRPRPTSTATAAPAPTSSTAVPSPSPSASGADPDDPPGEGGGSRAKADKRLTAAVAFELPNYAHALAWAAEPVGVYGKGRFLFDVDETGHVTACRDELTGRASAPPLLATTIERLCKRLARGTYAIGDDGLVKAGTQRILFEVVLSDVPVSDAPADGVGIDNKPNGAHAGDVILTLVGGRRIVFSWRADNARGGARSRD